MIVDDLFMRDLLGTITLVRSWGRIGTAGWERVEAFGTVDEAGQALEALARVKERAGTRICNRGNGGQSNGCERHRRSARGCG